MENHVIKSDKSCLLPLLLSFCFVFSYDWYFFRESMFGIGSIFNILMLGCIYMLICSGMNAETRARRYGFAFGFIFSLALVIGRTMHDNNDITDLYATPEAAAYALLSLLSFTAVFGLGSALVLEASGNLSDSPAVSRNITTRPAVMFAAIWAFIFLCWLPVYLAYYPGVFAYDAKAQYAEAVGMIPLTRMHPPLHTLFLRLCLIIVSFVIPWDPPDGLDIALCIYSISQMLILSAMFARTVMFFINRNFSNTIVILILLFFSVNPVVALFSFNMTKDVLFSGAFLMFALELCELASSPEKFFASLRSLISFAVWALLACLLRNNCVHALVLSAFLILFIMRGFRVRILALFAAPILCFMLISGPGYDALGVIFMPIQSREPLSVPIQQIARVASQHSDELSDSDKSRIHRFISEEAVDEWVPRFADPVKGQFDADAYNENPHEFWKLWSDIGTRFPLDYASAFLSLNLASWYYDTENVSQITKYSQDDYYIGTNITLKIISISGRPDPLERRSKIPALLPIYESIATFDAFGSLPFISQTFSVSTPIWLMTACLFVLLYKKSLRGITVLVPPLALWATHMAGPVTYFRYMFPLFVMYPLFIALALYPKSMLKQAAAARHEEESA